MYFSKINDIKELQKEKGLYYPYIMQILGAPVINGSLICATDLKYFYSMYTAGVFEILAGMYIPNKEDEKDHSNKVFKKISIAGFKISFLNAVSDLFCGGCEPEDFDEDKFFGFFDKEEQVLVDKNNPFGKTVTRKKYGEYLVP